MHISHFCRYSKVSRCGYAHLHPWQQCWSVLSVPHPHQHLVLSVSLILEILVDFKILGSILEVELFPHPPELETLNFHTFIFRNASCTKAGNYTRYTAPSTVFGVWKEDGNMTAAIITLILIIVITKCLLCSLEGREQVTVDQGWIIRHSLYP